MKRYIKGIFFNKKNDEKVEKRSISDFFLHATPEEKNYVFTKAAKKASEDQKELLNA